MLLRRLGNKTKMANKIMKFAPPHTLYIEPFFGAGGMFFNKKKARYNIVNDQDSEVFNLFQILMNNKQELINMLLLMPVHQDLWNYWKLNKEIDPVKKAVRFLMLSNFGLYGKPDTLRYNGGNASQILLEDIEQAYKFMYGVEFMNCDFRVMFDKISLRDNQRKEHVFIYADPPYLETTCYEQHFTEKDSADLFDILQSTRAKWAMSEFDQPIYFKRG